VKKVDEQKMRKERCIGKRELYWKVRMLWTSILEKLERAKVTSILGWEYNGSAISQKHVFPLHLWHFV
jgi:DMSO/TMAO reductase YedYZ molybdopterin-dependent catalytic subunit